MLEYVFFHEKPYKLFLSFLNKKGLKPKTRVEDDFYEISLPEEIDEGLSDAIEEEYDLLLSLNQDLVESLPADSRNAYQKAGIVLNLKDGTVSYADIPPALLSRIMEVLTPEEFGQVVNAVVDGVESPDTRSLCERARSAD